MAVNSSDAKFRKQGKDLKNKKLNITDTDYKAIFDAVPQTVSVTTFEDGIYLEVNDFFTQLTGYTREETLGKTPFDLNLFVDPSDRKRYLELLEKEDEIIGFKTRYRWKDGSIMDALLSAKRLRFDGGDYLICSATDISDLKRSEMALRKSEEKFVKAFENSPVGISISTLEDGRYLEVNKAFERFTGYSRQEIIGRTSTELNLWKEPDDRRGLINYLRQNERLNNYEVVARYKSGETRNLLTSAEIIQLDEQAGVLITCIDITPRKQAEILMNMQRDLSAALSATQDLEQGLQICLDAALNLSQMDCGGIYLIDKASGALDLVYYKGLNSEFIKGVEHFDSTSIMVRLVTDGKPHYTHYGEFENCLGVIGGDKSLKAIAIVPIYHQDQVIGCLDVVSYHLDEVPEDSRLPLEAIARQIGSALARLKAEEALRESEEKYRLLVENANDAIFIAQDETVKFPNPKALAMVGYSAEELARMPFVSLIHPEDRNMVLERYRKRLQGEKLPQTYSFRIINAKGEELWTQLNTELITWEGRSATLNIIRDVTEQKKMEADLQRALRLEAIGTLAGGIAHDFNNLLMGIQGRVSLMMVKTDPSHPHHEHLKGIEEYVKSAANLTKQLLGFARGGKYEVKPINLNEIIEKSAGMFGRTRKEIHIHEQYQEGIWTVEADKGQIEQVLLNLYVNAWQSMPGGGDLYLTTQNSILDDSQAALLGTDPGRYVKIIIADSGVGLDETTSEKIFEPFFTTKGMGRGAGLGLASAYGIIKNHNGIIDVDGEKGKGTTFSIYLPASQRAVGKEKIHNREIWLGTGTILLVDDENMILDVGREVLKQIGYRALTANTGRTAIDLYRANKDEIDLVILDMIMPNMGGGETYDNLKEIDPRIKVLLSSGYSLNGQATEILARGCNGFIQKPFDMEELSQKIRDILDEAS